MMTTTTAEDDRTTEPRHPPATPAGMTRDAYRDAMAGLAAAVNLVTTDGVAGPAGFTATAVCSVTDDPPTLLVCVKRDSSVGEAFRRNGVLCVNTLGIEHRALSTLFGGRTPVAERFAAATFAPGITGAPVLADALTYFDCRISRSVDIGTHAVLFATVESVGARGSGATGLLYAERGYRQVAGLDAGLAAAAS